MLTDHKCIAMRCAQATFASSPFSILAQQLAGLLSGVLFRSLALKDNHWSACTALYAIYNETLAYMLPGGLLELSGAERAGELPASDAALPLWCLRMSTRVVRPQGKHGMSFE
jgi:hypothetical protein